ncbi:hypothetical protein C451_20225 [Halococcus thailandensis JCM 13552]|uniref:Uncharacterized protein n=1 Tax=Halococcus thailandensis JCM 13552 TaxID=1227457 RepID=M0MUW0_9EURY|nr:hypothetical protein C451_20225 [Halococcus thailandensis JCM 13552]
MVREIGRVEADLPGYLWHLAQEVEGDTVGFLEVNPKTVEQNESVVGESAASSRGRQIRLCHRERLWRTLHKSWSGKLRTEHLTVSRFRHLHLTIHPPLYSDSPEPMNSITRSNRLVT